jgi:hypothetical protein
MTSSSIVSILRLGPSRRTQICCLLALPPADPPLPSSLQSSCPLYNDFRSTCFIRITTCLQPHTSHHIMILLQFLLFLSFFLVDQVLAHVTL